MTIHMNCTKSFQEIIQEVAEQAIEERLKSWMRYEFEKRMLPELLKEATEKVRVHCFTNANIPEEVKIMLKFESTKIV